MKYLIFKTPSDIHTTLCMLHTLQEVPILFGCFYRVHINKCLCWHFSVYYYNMLIFWFGEWRASLPKPWRAFSNLVASFFGWKLKNWRAWSHTLQSALTLMFLFYFIGSTNICNWLKIEVWIFWIYWNLTHWTRRRWQSSKWK